MTIPDIAFGFVFMIFVAIPWIIVVVFSFVLGYHKTMNGTMRPPIRKYLVIMNAMYFLFAAVLFVLFCVFAYDTYPDKFKGKCCMIIFMLCWCAIYFIPFFRLANIMKLNPNPTIDKIHFGLLIVGELLTGLMLLSAFAAFMNSMRIVQVPAVLAAVHWLQHEPHQGYESET